MASTDHAAAINTSTTSTPSGRTGETTNLTATLLATNGITAPGGPQNYGVLVTNGPSVSRQFQFTVSAASGSQIGAVLQLQDGATNLGTATFNFLVGSVTNSFTNSAP